MEDSTREEAISHLHSYLSRDLCGNCCDVLYTRIQQLAFTGALDVIRIPGDEDDVSSLSVEPITQEKSINSYVSPTTPRKWTNESRSSNLHSSGHPSNSRGGETSGGSVSYGTMLMKGLSLKSPTSLSSNDSLKHRKVVTGEGHGEVGDCDDLDEGNHQNGQGGHVDLSREQREWIRYSLIRRKKDFVLIEKVNGRMINVLQGLELHAGVFNAKEQEKIVNCVYSFQKLGREGRLKERTYSEPKKWMRGKGRVTIQFGCCYNYAPDKNGNPPGIIRDEEVDPLPPLLKMMIKRMVRWHVLPPSCVPNSCIINIYNEGDCIPPHIDHHDFVRPFCTVSFLAECNILFGQNLRIAGPGEFSGPIAIPLPVGSVFILNGKGADVAKHCVPAVPAKRISITFRKMDDSKLPYRFKPDPEIQGIRPLQNSDRPQQPQVQVITKSQAVEDEVPKRHNDFPSLAELNSGGNFPPLSGINSNGKKHWSAPKKTFRNW